MKSISSRDNPRFKELKQLAGSSQVRRKTGRTLLDGIHLCQAYLDYGSIPSLCVVGADSATHPEVAAIVARCEAEGVECLVFPDVLYSALSQVEHGVGLLFVIETPQPVAIGALSESAVLLDNLQDPGNLGSILRSAAAAGIRHVFCSMGTCFAWSPKVLRAGMGAHFLLNIHENVDLAACIQASKVPVLATSSYAEQTVYEINLCQPTAWIFGHEGQGVADDLLELASHRLSIPHLGKVESLNVAACAAVCFFEQVRQIREGKKS